MSNDDELPTLGEALGAWLGVKLPSIPLPQTIRNLDKAIGKVRSARELCIASILVCNEFQECASTLVAENPAEAAMLLKALCDAVPAATAAYGEALKSREQPRLQDNDGAPQNIRCWTGPGPQAGPSAPRKLCYKDYAPRILLETCGRLRSIRHLRAARTSHDSHQGGRR
jgi:hypothetical protein